VNTTLAFLCVMLAVVVIALVGLGFYVASIVKRVNQETVPAEAETEPAGEVTTLPVVANDMPRVVTYTPRDGATRTCTCHPDRPLRPGQQVMWWPIPQPVGAVLLFCEDGIPSPAEGKS
jgi:hypothetical protein